MLKTGSFSPNVPEQLQLVEQIKQALDEALYNIMNLKKHRQIIMPKSAKDLG